MKPKATTKTALWSGRFSQGAHHAVQAFTKSVQYDWRLYKHDIRGSKAHAEMLQSIGILTKKELGEIVKGLDQIQAQIEKGTFRWNDSLEDVHMNIEAALTKLTPAGAKLHTGRSRNDQVATDVRLWLIEEIQNQTLAIATLQKALLSLAEKTMAQEIIIPGYTHLQRAQPIYIAHQFLAYMEMLERDRTRLLDAAQRANYCPLGSGAIAGSTLPLNRSLTAKMLGFTAPTQNSMDATTDRDFLIEYNAAAALLAVHLSRMGEDLVLWSTAEFGFLTIGDAFTTGSSLMPQKKNPDVAEIIRGKSARVIGNLTALLVLLKGLPMTYNRDLQEDKERLFDTADTISSSLHVMALMLGDLTFHKQRCLDAASDPLLLATDVADELVRTGIPFREAHEISGKAVALSEKIATPIHKLTIEQWKNIDPRVPESVSECFHLARALAKRTSIGAPSPPQIRKQITRWKKVL